MFGNDTTIYTFTGPWGVRVEIGSSMLVLGLMLLMLGRGDLIFSAVVFACLVLSIFLHEFGHAWACLKQGIPVRRVVLYGGGGFCEHGRSPSRHQQEFIVAMGPIVNLALWAGTSLFISNVDVGGAYWMLFYFARINLFLAVFNLLPIQPLDGGKLFQLILMRFMRPVPATRIAGGVGLVFAVLWIPMLIIGFLYMGFLLFFFPNFRLHWQMWNQR